MAAGERGVEGVAAERGVRGVAAGWGGVWEALSPERKAWPPLG
jgi:hypothetical protein